MDYGLVRWLCLGLLTPALAAQPRPDLPPQFTAVVLPTGGDPETVKVADVNGDGRLDILAANPESGSVTVLLGDGKGHFHAAPGSPFSAGHLPNDIGVGDFDGDGHADLLIANHQAPYVTLLLGDGRGGFRAAPHSPFTTRSVPHPHGVAVGRFCGNDQPLDAVIDSWGTHQVELLQGDGHGNLANGPMFPAGPGSDRPLRSADFNGDGIPDIVTPDTAIGHWDSDKVSVLLGDGKCGLHPAPGSPFSGGAVPWSVAVGDLNGDGAPDLIVLSYAPQVRDPHAIAATVLLNDGRGAFHSAHGSPYPLPGCDKPLDVAIGNLVGKAPTDFVVTCMQSSTILLFLGDAHEGYRVFPLAVPTGKAHAPGERGVALADLTGSGRSDIIVTNGSAGSITLLLRK